MAYGSLASKKALAVSRGIQRERNVVKLLREDGWWAIRSPASKGDVDVVAIKGEQGFSRHPVGRLAESQPLLSPRVLFVECKSTAAGPWHSFGPADRRALSGAATQAGAEAWLVWWPPRKQPTWLPESQWPR